MANNDTLHKFEMPSANFVDTDYKGEVVAAGIIENGMDAEQVFIARLGNEERGYSKDIEYLRTTFSHRNQTEYLGVYTNRAGLYNLLPEGLFHRIKRSSINRTKEELISEIRKLQKEEEKVRKLFSPFERSIDNALINAQFHERQLDKKYTNRNFTNVFSRLWPILEILPLHKAMLLVEIIPLLSKLVCNMETVSSILSAILDVPVTVKNGEKTSLHADRSAIPRLSEMRLGVNSVLSNTLSTEYTIDVKIGPMTNEQILYYMTDRNGKRVVKYLTDLLFPADREVRLTFLMIRGNTKCFISEDKTKTARLGVNSYL